MPPSFLVSYRAELGVALQVVSAHDSVDLQKESSVFLDGCNVSSADSFNFLKYIFIF